MKAHLDETFVSALRDALVDHVNTTARQPWYRKPKRWLAGAGAVFIIGAAGGGIAYATGAWSPPGSDTVTHVAAPVTTSGAGTMTVNLGRPPAGTTSIDVRLTCLSEGTFTVQDGASISCQSTDVGSRSDTMSYTLAAAAGSHDTTITTSAGSRWRLTATYSTVTVSPWAVNTHGQTYGVQNEHGTPDLILAIATNGKTGYIYESQLERGEAPPATPSQAIASDGKNGFTVTVFKSDGRTPIGKFVVTQSGGR